MTQPSPQTTVSSRGIFRRLLLMLRPHWGSIALAVVLLLLSSPAELFPGMTWMYVTDQLILNDHTKAVAILHRLFSFDGLLTGKIHLLFSAICWMFVVYFLLRIFNRKIAPIYKAARERAGDVSTRLQENLAGVVVIKIFGREKQEAARFRGATESYYDQQVRSIGARSTYFPVARIV